MNLSQVTRSFQSGGIEQTLINNVRVQDKFGGPATKEDVWNKAEVMGEIRR